MKMLEEIHKRGRQLTKRQLEVLRIMSDNEHDPHEGIIVYERGDAYIGDTRIAARTVFALLRACAISELYDGGIHVEHYRINETGKNILKAYRLAERKVKDVSM